MSVKETEMGSTQDLISQFEASINSSTQRINEFIAENNKNWGEVNVITQQLRSFIEQIKNCLDSLVSLRNFYMEFLGRLRTLKGKQEEKLSGEIRKLEQSGDQKCKSKIESLLKQFRTFISSFNQLEVGTTSQLKEQVERLDAEIKRLCNDTDGIIKQMEGTKGEMNTLFPNQPIPRSQMRPKRAPPPIPLNRGGFMYGKKLKKKKNIRSLSSLKKKNKTKKSIFNKKKKIKNLKKRKSRKNTRR